MFYEAFMCLSCEGLTNGRHSADFCPLCGSSSGMTHVAVETVYSGTWPFRKQHTIIKQIERGYPRELGPHYKKKIARDFILQEDFITELTKLLEVEADGEEFGFVKDCLETVFSRPIKRSKKHAR